jgi:hypothetical protein
MTKAFEAGPRELSDDRDEDTIELQLNTQEMLTLARAAGEEPAATPFAEAQLGKDLFAKERMANESPANEPRAEVPAAELKSTLAQSALGGKASSAGGLARTVRGPLGRGAVALGIAAAVIALGSAAHRAADRKPLAAAIAPKISAAPTPAASPSPEPDSTPVRFKNPFDRSEVFEFPPGTSEADARQAVADILLQRAHDRQSQAGGAKRVGSTPAASGRTVESARVTQASARADR